MHRAASPEVSEQWLLDRYRRDGDVAAREELVRRMAPLVRRVAGTYHARGHEDDLLQVAWMGLVKAIDRYDVSRGGAFSSFAVPTMAGEVKRYYRDRTWSVHVPRDLQDLTLDVERARAELERELSRSPTVPEISERLGIEDEEVVEALQARHAHRAASLDAPVRDDDLSVGTVGEALGQPEDGFARAEARADLEILGRVLTPRERLVLRLRFERDMTQQEIGDRLGVSQMQISRIVRSAIARQREYAEQRRSVAAEVASLAA
jgi:RNA polymerase sigma-B factor